MIRYICQSHLLPVIEGTLAAHGYRVEIPMRVRSNGAGTMVMTRGLTSVLLAQWSETAMLEIEIWGVAQPFVSTVLEALPIRWHKQFLTAIAVREGG